MIARSAMKAGTTNGLGLSVEANRQQRATTMLIDVAYVIEAHFAMTDKAGPDDSPAKHISMFNRRAAQGQCFHRPCLGVREFPAEFALLSEDQAAPESAYRGQRIDFGWMLHDIDFANDNTSRFFRAEMVDGVIVVPPLSGPNLVA